MLRVVLNSKGDVIWQYKMLRIVRGDGYKETTQKKVLHNNKNHDTTIDFEYVCCGMPKHASSI